MVLVFRKTVALVTQLICSFARSDAGDYLNILVRHVGKASVFLKSSPKEVLVRIHLESHVAKNW